MNDLLYAQGQDNLAGLVGEIYYCPSEDILTLPALAVASSLKTAAADIVCKSTKKFARVYMTDETGKVEPKTVGEEDGKGRETMLTFRYPAMGTELEDFISDVQNTPAVILYRLARNGKWYLLGVSRLNKAQTTLSLAIPAKFTTGDGSSGEKRADQNGAVLGWRFGSAHGPIEYAGDTADLLVAAP